MSPVKKPTVKLDLPVREEQVRACRVRSYTETLKRGRDTFNEDEIKYFEDKINEYK
tara:strand:+ start:525 stop:692 length:168 start_codon:yes stop_codon:yes gene_type:complete